MIGEAFFIGRATRRSEVGHGGPASDGEWGRRGKAPRARIDANGFFKA